MLPQAGRPKKYKHREIVTFNTESSIYEEFSKIAEREREAKSDIFTKLMAEYIKQHSASNNPQSIITQFDREEVRAVPNLYNADQRTLTPFYNGMTLKEYKEADTKLNLWLHIHNEAGIKLGDSERLRKEEQRKQYWKLQEIKN